MLWIDRRKDLLNPANVPSCEEAEPGDMGSGYHISVAEANEMAKKLGGNALEMIEICPEYLKALDVVGLS